MTSSAFDTDVFADFERKNYKSAIQELIPPTLNKFRSILRSYTYFNLIFLLLITGEITCFFVYLVFLTQSFVMAIYFALIFATLFCFATLNVYLHTRKTEKTMELAAQFISHCRGLAEGHEKTENPLVMVAHACCQMAAELHAREYTIFSLPSWCHFLSSSFEKLNCWWFWRDVHFMKESLLKTCVTEYIALIRTEPTNLEAHAGLANAYVMLSGLFVNPKSIEELDDDRWIPPGKYDEAFQAQFRTFAEKAIEEFKILSDYAPRDPWVHLQLAYSYRDLNMPKEEIQEYELLLQLCPSDAEILYKLGRLYFETGQNAKGLQVYESLKSSQSKKAENLIHYYGASN